MTAHRTGNLFATRFGLSRSVDFLTSDRSQRGWQSARGGLERLNGDGLVIRNSRCRLADVAACAGLCSHAGGCRFCLAGDGLDRGDGRDRKRFSRLLGRGQDCGGGRSRARLRSGRAGARTDRHGEPGLVRFRQSASLPVPCRTIWIAALSACLDRLGRGWVCGFRMGRHSSVSAPVAAGPRLSRSPDRGDPCADRAVRRRPADRCRASPRYPSRAIGRDGGRADREAASGAALAVLARSGAAVAHFRGGGIGKAGTRARI